MPNYNEKDDSNNADRQRLIKEVAIEVVSQIRDGIKADDEEKQSDVGKAILATLKARYINITRVINITLLLGNEPSLQGRLRMMMISE